MTSKDLVDAILSQVQQWVAENPPNGGLLARWSAAEGVDADLSQIVLADGTVLRGVPKFAHVTGLSANDVILCLNFGNKLPLIIAGKVVGDISLFGG